VRGRLSATVFLVTAVFAAAPTPAGVELVLRNGRTLSGESAELKDDVYLVTLVDGESFTVPVALVTEVRLGKDFDDRPSGMVVGIPRTLAGPPGPARTPTPDEQLAAFGEPPASFTPSIIGTGWRPKDAFEGKEARLDPARWFEAPIDPSWTPISAFRASKDVTEFNPVHWYQSPIDPVWRPRSGWSSPRWFPPVVRTR